MEASDRSPHVRRAAPEDAAALLRLIDALAAYERLVPPDEQAKKRLIRDIFGPRPRLEAFLGLIDDTPAGYALVFETYSSFLALPSLYLEDIFVLPELGGKGVGLALFRAMVGEAHARGCGRMEWMVLDWNSPAIRFYDRLGARHMKEWQLYRLTRQEMATLLAEKMNF